MKQTALLSGYVFQWNMKKGGWAVYVLSILAGVISAVYRGYAGMPGETSSFRAKGFLPYELIIDQSLIPIFFCVGLLALLLLQYMQLRQYRKEGKGIYTFLTLPMKGTQVADAFLFQALAMVFLYYAPVSYTHLDVYKRQVLERGGDVDSRKEAVDKFWQTGQLDVDNNVQFGEGGAGTFSDGKLTTRIKDPRCRKVLEEFVAAGAPGEILYDSKPHIGTDLLRGVVKEIRQKIISLGGEVRFFSKVTDIFSENGMVTAVEINGKERLDASYVVLALGHSARDTFAMLYEKGFALEQKPFAMGVRIEHPQEMVNVSQYGEAADQLPAADYRLTYTTTKGRGVYTFCMCPGGYVVAAASEEGRLAVNGMSEHARDGQNANSALLVQVFPEDFGSEHPLAGMYFQRVLEEKAFQAGGGNYTAPVQTVGSFLQDKENVFGQVCPTYAPKTVFADMKDCLLYTS